MAQENRIRIVGLRFRNRACHRHWPKLGVNESHLVFGVQQRSAHRKQPQGRQMFPRDAAADGGMQRIEQEDFHRWNRIYGPFGRRVPRLLCITKYMMHRLADLFKL